VQLVVTLIRCWVFLVLIFVVQPCDVLEFAQPIIASAQLFLHYWTVKEELFLCWVQCADSPPTLVRGQHFFPTILQEFLRSFLNVIASR
jgi:hypothetical protein